MASRRAVSKPGGARPISATCSADVCKSRPAETAKHEMDISIKGWGDGRMFHDVRSRDREPNSLVPASTRVNGRSWEWWPGVGDLRLMGTRETSHRSRAVPIFTPLTFGRESFPPAR